MAGWDDLEASDEVTETFTEDINLLMAKAFASDEGRKVLAWMRQTYLERPCWQPGADASLGQWREGQNDVIRDIEARIRKAKNQ